MEIVAAVCTPRKGEDLTSEELAEKIDVSKI